MEKRKRRKRRRKLKATQKHYNWNKRSLKPKSKLTSWQSEIATRKSTESKKTLKM